MDNRDLTKQNNDNKRTVKEFSSLFDLLQNELLCKMTCSLRQLSNSRQKIHAKNIQASIAQAIDTN